MLDSSLDIPYLQGGFEVGLFWNDLSSPVAGTLIEGVYTGATCTGYPSVDSQLRTYLPAAKLGGQHSLYVYQENARNFFGLSAVSGILGGALVSTPSIRVRQAHAIDAKTDDGLPVSGRVLARYVTTDSGAGVLNAPSAANSSAATCFETTNNNYSVAYNGGSGSNCGLSFQFQ